MADLASKLDEITEMVESARALPLSASCVLNRAELLAELAALHDLLPQEVRDAREVLGDRAGVLEQGRREAERLVARGEAERDRLVADGAVMALATDRAASIVQEAQQAAESMRREVDDYVDGKLATFEIALNRTLAAVTRGREKLRGRSELDQLADGGQDGDPVPDA